MLHESGVFDLAHAVACRAIDAIPKAVRAVLAESDAALAAAVAAAPPLDASQPDPPTVEAATCAALEVLNDVCAGRAGGAASPDGDDSDDSDAGPPGEHDRFSALAQQAALALRLAVGLLVQGRYDSARKMLEVAAGCSVTAREAPALSTDSLTSAVWNSADLPRGVDPSVAAAAQAVIRAQVRLAAQLDAVTALSLSLLGSQRNGAERLAECGFLAGPLAATYSDALRPVLSALNGPACVAPSEEPAAPTPGTSPSPSPAAAGAAALEPVDALAKIFSQDAVSVALAEVAVFAALSAHRSARVDIVTTSNGPLADVAAINAAYARAGVPWRTVHTPERGKGVYAFRDIQLGEIMLREPPVVPMPPDAVRRRLDPSSDEDSSEDGSASGSEEPAEDRAPAPRRRRVRPPRCAQCHVPVSEPGNTKSVLPNARWCSGRARGCGYMYCSGLCEATAREISGHGLICGTPPTKEGVHFSRMPVCRNGGFGGVRNEYAVMAIGLYGRIANEVALRLFEPGDTADPTGAAPIGDFATWSAQCGMPDERLASQPSAPAAPWRHPFEPRDGSVAASPECRLSRTAPSWRCWTLTEAMLERLAQPPLDALPTVAGSVLTASVRKEWHCVRSMVTAHAAAAAALAGSFWFTEWGFVTLIYIIQLNGVTGGLFDMASFMNHSCSPSATLDSSDTGTNMLHVVSLRKILAGEEITISYLGATPEDPTPARRAKLFATYYFWCMCHRCKEHDARLLRAAPSTE